MKNSQIENFYNEQAQARDIQIAYIRIINR